MHHYVPLTRSRTIKLVKMVVLIITCVKIGVKFVTCIDIRLM